MEKAPKSWGKGYGARRAQIYLLALCFLPLCLEAAHRSCLSLMLLICEMRIIPTLVLVWRRLGQILRMVNSLAVLANAFNLLGGRGLTDTCNITVLLVLFSNSFAFYNAYMSSLFILFIVY